MLHNYNHYNILHEYTKSDLLGRGKSDTADRYARRLDYIIDDYDGVDLGELEKGNLMIRFIVQGGDAYRVLVMFENYLPLLRTYIERMSGNPYTWIIEESLDDVVNNFDIKVSCNCPDFIYRFGYIATTKGYKVTEPETRYPEVTNPDLKGYVCKHLFMVLSNASQWKRKVRKMIRKGTLGLGLVDESEVVTRDR